MTVYRGALAMSNGEVAGVMVEYSTKGLVGAFL